MWRDEWEWPLARTLYRPYYLRAKGLLSPEKPERDAKITYQFDPKNPVPTRHRAALLEQAGLLGVARCNRDHAPS